MHANRALCLKANYNHVFNNIWRFWWPRQWNQYMHVISTFNPSGKTALELPYFSILITFDNRSTFKQILQPSRDTCRTFSQAMCGQIRFGAKHESWIKKNYTRVHHVRIISIFADICGKKWITTENVEEAFEWAHDFEIEKKISRWFPSKALIIVHIHALTWF